MSSGPLNRRIIVATLVAWLALAVYPPASEAQPVNGGQAPPFDLEALGGSRVSLDDFRGKIVVLHFGAGW